MKLALLCALLCACATTQPVSLAQPTQQIRSKDYTDYLKKWSRKGHLLSDFDAALNVVATFHSPEFRQAYAERYVVTYRVGPFDRDRVRQEVIADGAGTWEFHVESATHKYELNDFTSAKSLWRITLLDNHGREIAKPEVSTTTKRRDLEIFFYPFADEFTRGWRLRFPRNLPDCTPLITPETTALTLRFAGPQGSVDLVWKLIPGEVPIPAIPPAPGEAPCTATRLPNKTPDSPATLQLGGQPNAPRKEQPPPPPLP